MASADIWFPFVSTTKSSNTISSVFIETAAPSLITVAVGAVTSLNLSIVFLALISWNIPIDIFAIIIAIKSKSV